jgi:hypothetical protein
VFLNFPDPSHQTIFPWEHRNIGGSVRWHNSLGIFYRWTSLKIQREIKREVFTSVRWVSHFYDTCQIWFS